MTAYTIAAVNAKGGVTKTTTSLNLAIWLARSGQKVLLCDVDPQSNSTYTLTGVLSKTPHNTLYDVFIENRDIREIIRDTKVDNLWLAPGSLWLSKADLQLAGRTGREYILRNVLEGVAKGFDYIIIDTPPNLGILTVNALVSCTGFMVVLVADVFAAIGIEFLKASVKDLSDNLRIPIPLLGAVVSIMDNTKECRDWFAYIQEQFGDALFSTTIPKNVKVKESNDKHILFDYAPSSPGALAYAELGKEVAARVQQVKAAR